MQTDSDARKEMPIYSGVLRYFPDALAEVAKLSKIGNDKHNPGEPLHWSRGKSADQLDSLCRHLAECGTLDTDGLYHDVKVAWRALANLQELLEKEKGLPISPGSRVAEKILPDKDITSKSYWDHCVRGKPYPEAEPPKPIDDEAYAKALRQFWDTRDPDEAHRMYESLRSLRPNQTAFAELDEAYRRYWAAQTPAEEKEAYKALWRAKSPQTSARGWQWGDNSVDPWPDGVDPA